jgi:hypothetical protein
MAITTAICSTFKEELLEGLHNLGSSGNALKMGLFKQGVSGSYGAATTNYSNMGADETSGTGYTAGGSAVTSAGVSLATTIGRADMNNVQWTSASFSTDGCLLYNTTASNRAIGVWSFGGTQTVSAGTFLIQMPAVGDSTSLIRIA